MIVVEVVIPYLSRAYELELDEHMTVGKAAEEAAEVICTKERWNIPERSGNLNFFDPEEQRILAQSHTFAEEAIQSGHRLILC